MSRLICNPQNFRSMKNIKPAIRYFTSLIVSGFFILFFNSCQDFTEDEIILEDSDYNQGLIPWNDLLNQLDSESEIGFVQNGQSIQEALDDALPGDIIYIEPGNYSKPLSTNTSSIKLIGLSLKPDDLVIDINSHIPDNLSINNYEENDIEIIKLYDRKSTDKIKNTGNENRISDFSRTELNGGIVHYQFNIRLGNGEFDIVRMHRVVRENWPFRPITTEGQVFMVHGAFTGFDRTFLTPGLDSSDEINEQSSSPFYLASENIDVWGIDMGWTMVPNSATDFSFFKDWGYEKDASHTLKAMQIARLIRGLSGQGFSRLNLLGFSSGNTVAYAAANSETQQKCLMKRHINGIITIDNAFKNPDGDSGCTSAQTIKDDIGAGNHQNTNGQFFQTLGFLALNYPNEISPILGDPTTNIQAFRLIFARDIFGFGMHFFGGDMNGLFYVDETRALRVLSNYSHYMPNLQWQEIDAVNCSTMNVSFDGYLNLISVPILSIAAGGGAADTAFYTGSLTASTDITNHLVSQHAEFSEDFGHIDNWIADDASYRVWSVLRNWIVNHP